MRKLTNNARPAISCHVAALAVVCLLVSVGCRKQPAILDPEEGRVVADKFMELLRSGNAGQAWDETSVEFKSAEGRESFVRSTKKRPWLAKPATFETVESIAGPQVSRAEYVYRSADSRHHVRLHVGPDRAAWRVERMDVD